MSDPAISPRFAQSLRAIVHGAEAPGATASAMVGAVMSAIGELYGHEVAAELLYALADATATLASSDRAARARESRR